MNNKELKVLQSSLGLSLTTANPAEYPLGYSDDIWLIIGNNTPKLLELLRNKGTYTLNEVNEALALGNVNVDDITIEKFLNQEHNQQEIRVKEKSLTKDHLKDDFATDLEALIDVSNNISTYMINARTYKEAALKAYNDFQQFIQNLIGLGVDAGLAAEVAARILADNTLLAYLQSFLIDVEEEGFYICDKNYRVIFKINNDGFDALTIDNHLRHDIGLINVEEQGFFVCDAEYHVVLEYTRFGFDAALISDHFRGLIGTGGTTIPDPDVKPELPESPSDGEEDDTPTVVPGEDVTPETPDNPSTDTIAGSVGANGLITLNNNLTGAYTLKYLDSNGNVLNGYADMIIN